MLRPDKAEKELAKFRSESHAADRLARVGRLQAAPRQAGHLLLGRDADGSVFLDWQKRNRAANRSVRCRSVRASSRSARFCVALCRTRQSTNTFPSVSRPSSR